jgi:hypothetical protein
MQYSFFHTIVKTLDEWSEGDATRGDQGESLKNGRSIVVLDYVKVDE